MAQFEDLLGKIADSRLRSRIASATGVLDLGAICACEDPTAVQHANPRHSPPGGLGCWVGCAHGRVRELGSAGLANNRATRTIADRVEYMQR